MRRGSATLLLSGALLLSSTHGQTVPGKASAATTSGTTGAAVASAPAQLPISQRATLTYDELISFPAHLPEDLDRSELDRRIVSVVEGVTPSAIEIVLRGDGWEWPIPLSQSGSFTLPNNPSVAKARPLVVSNQPKGTLRLECTAFGEEVEEAKRKAARKVEEEAWRLAVKYMEGAYWFDPSSNIYRGFNGSSLGKPAYQRRLREMALGFLSHLRQPPPAFVWRIDF